jgi:hypothetical protein
MNGDGWAEYVRSVLERESSPLYDEQKPKTGRAYQLRHAKDWVDPRGAKAPVPDEELPPLTIFRM